MLFELAIHGGMKAGRRLCPLFALCFVILILGLGCQRLHLPAIDPDGRCLFLPFPNTTQLTVPSIHSSPDRLGIIPTPAYQNPVPPPACLDGSCEPAGMCNLFQRKHQCLEKIHNHFRSPGKVGELQLSPMRIVAPVGGEVVLLAGICGEDGYLVKREPIEWMLSPDSVGQIIQVNDDAPGRLSSLVHPHRPKVEKLDVDFAKGRTSSKSQIIDRGTADCNDDIHLRDGETWLSLSSPSAGITRVTALAPESKIWDRRRQTAVIYWLDAQWEFPPPQIVKADQRAMLRTKVTKAEGFVPATGWVVQYTLVDPTVANFSGPANAVRIDERTIRSTVDQDGIGYAELTAAAGAIGTTAVLIDVISPAQPAENIPELVVGRGQTFATFSSAGLQLQLLGPESISKGEQATFSISLANPGDIDAENTKLILNLPQGLKLISANLQPSAVTDIGAVWNQDLLPANRQLDIAFVAEALAAGTFETAVQAEASGVTSVRQTVRTEVIEPAIDLRFAASGGISQAEVGQIVPYEIDVANTGRQTLTNLLLKVKSDPGLVEVSSGTDAVEQLISYLQPGETRHLELPFRVQQEGQHRAVVQALVNNIPILERSASILGTAPRPKTPQMGIEITFPLEDPQLTSRQIGQPLTALITLRNSGEVTLTNPVVEVTTDGNVFEFTRVDPNNELVTEGGGGFVRWSPGNLLPGEQGDRVRQLRLQVVTRNPSPGTAIQVVARSAEGVQASATSKQLQVMQQPAVIPPTTPPATLPPAIPPAALPPTEPPAVLPSPETTDGTLAFPNAPTSGKLSISLNAFNDPELVNRDIRYGLTVTNNSNRENKRVQIQIRLPEGAIVRGVSSQGVEVAKRFGADQSLLLQVIEYMRPNESINYIVVLQSRIPQQMRVEASVRSDLFPDAETASYLSTITPAN